MNKTLFPLAAMALATFALTACGASSSSHATGLSSSESSKSTGLSSSESSKSTGLSSSESLSSSSSSAEETPIRPIKAFSYGDASKAGATDLYNAYRVNLYPNNVYEYIETHITWGYSMNLGTSVVTTYGTYVDNGSEDGVTTYTLNQAAEVVLTSYSKAGGFDIGINTADPNQTYPVELPAKTQGEKNMAENKAAVIAAYGIGTKIYVGEDNVLSFIDPNSEEDTPSRAEVTTPSGSVSSVLKEFKQVQSVSQISGEGMVHYVVDAIHIFKDNSYKHINTDITFGYSMVLGTATNVTFGQGSYGTGEDGYTPYTLTAADDVALTSYSKAGGFSIAVNTADEDLVYPVELPAKTQGEKNMAENKAAVIAEYGASVTVFTSDSGNVMSLVDPNA